MSISYRDEECPMCGNIWKVEEWTDGFCSVCGNEYWWEEEYIEDFDSFTNIIWGKYPV